MLWLVCLIVASCLFLMTHCPDTPVGKALHRYCAVEPVRWLSERKRSDLFYFLLLTGFAIAGGEVFALLGPEVVLMYSADLAVYLDLAVFSSLAAVGARIRSASHAVRAYALSVRARVQRTSQGKAREGKTRGEGSSVRADNDDEDSRHGHLLAA